MLTTALMRASVYVITAISARSRRPTSQGASASEPSGKMTFLTTLMLSSSRLACSSVRTGVLPRLTTCLGPRTACAGLDRDLVRVIGRVDRHLVTAPRPAQGHNQRREDQKPARHFDPERRHRTPSGTLITRAARA